MATTVLQPSLIAPRFMVKQYVIDNISVSASSSTEASCNIEVDHYTPFGILGIHIENASSSGNYWTRCACQYWHRSDTTFTLRIQNNYGTANAKVKATVDVLYRSIPYQE